jgi:hypothetical protein
MRTKKLKTLLNENHLPLKVEKSGPSDANIALVALATTGTTTLGPEKIHQPENGRRKGHQKQAAKSTIPGQI